MEVGRAIRTMIVIACWQTAGACAQAAPNPFPRTSNPGQANSIGQSKVQSEDDLELQAGTALTREGHFREAIPHLLAARGHVANEYAASFNLALCYVATDQFPQAIEILNALQGERGAADLQNLLAQAYIGNGQPDKALVALQKAAAIAPQNEKLYSLVANACMEHKNYSLGIKVVDLGLRNLPQSARLHYERAMFLAQMDELDQAKLDFESAGRLGQGSEIVYLALAQEKMFEGNMADAVSAAREGMKKGFENPVLFTILGDALIRSGISPGQAEFAEAQTALEKAVARQPNDAASQIALGRLDLMAGQFENAILHLEKARELEPAVPAVYANLAKAYQRHGDAQRAQDALAVLEKLNQEQAERISSAPGDRKPGYAGQSSDGDQSATTHP